MNYKELKLKAQTEHGGYTLLAAGVCVFVKSKYHIDNKEDITFRGQPLPDVLPKINGIEYTKALSIKDVIDWERYLDLCSDSEFVCVNNINNAVAGAYACS
jgi:hypothetical protein